MIEIERGIAATEPSGGREVREYSPTGELLRSAREIQENLQQQFEAKYDSLGRPREFTDAAGVVTHLEFDPLGRAIALEDASGVRTLFAYDTSGEVIRQTFAAGTGLETIRTLQRDALGRLIELKDRIRGAHAAAPLKRPWPDPPCAAFAAPPTADRAGECSCQLPSSVMPNLAIP